MTSVQSPVSESGTFARRSTFISHFTPSLMTPEVLETIFTGRHKLLEKLVGYCRSSVLTSGKQFTLLVGPRGFGKTHLIALTYYRLKAQEDLQDKMLLAWMREEEWGITSFLDFLLRVFRALEEEYPNLVPEGEMEALYGLSPAEAEARAAELLKEVAGRRTVVLLLENLDDIFAGLGDNGQKRLRAYLQENRFISMLATSPGLFNGVSRRTSAFFGFFRVVHLEPMTFEEAVSLLERLAQLRGDDELADYIRTPSGRARVRAIQHLAGGNYRVYVIFSQFLARETLDELVGPFMNMLDELTPYYQSRMQLLSPQQRKIIEFLVDYRAAAPVKLIAQRGFMTPQSASSQLADLQDKGYVRSTRQGRESFYELREPLMRLCMEVKRERGEPIKLFIDFIKIWYSKNEIEKSLDPAQVRTRLEVQWLQVALNSLQEDPKLQACAKDFQLAFDAKRWEQALSPAEELAALDNSIINNYLVAEVYAKKGDFLKALSVIDAFACQEIERVRIEAYTLGFYIAIQSDDDDLLLQCINKILNTAGARIVYSSSHLSLICSIFVLPLFPDFIRNKAGIIFLSGFNQKDWIPFIESGLLFWTVAIPMIGQLQKLISLDNWIIYWRSLMESKPTYSFGLRLMESAYRHFAGDEKALIELPVEERQVLVDLISEVQSNIESGLVSAARNSGTSSNTTIEFIWTSQKLFEFSSS